MDYCDVCEHDKDVFLAIGGKLHVLGKYCRLKEKKDRSGLGCLRSMR